MTLRTTFHELRRRRVFRVGGAYLVFAWVTVQASDILLPALGFPEWLLRVLVYMLILGFPVTMLVTWVMDSGYFAVSGETEAVRRRDMKRRRQLTLSFGLLTIFSTAMLFYFFNPVRTLEGVVATHGHYVIAVLPFSDLSASKDLEWFSEGLAEEVLNSLAQLPQLRVVSRTSSFNLKNSDADIRAIAQQLGADVILEGSVRRSKGTVRVTAQLIDAHSGLHLWSEVYDRALNGSLGLQSAIAASIVQELHGNLNLDEKALAAAHTQDSMAFELFLKARHAYRRRNAEQLREAEGLLQSAVYRDPEFSDAWALLAATWFLLPAYDLSLDQEGYMKQAEAAADRAFDIDPAQAEACAVKAMIATARLDYVQARELLEQALRKKPDLPDANHWLGLNLAGLGYHNEARPWLERAAKLDPGNAAIRASLGLLEIWSGNIEKGREHLQQASALGWADAELNYLLSLNADEFDAERVERLVALSAEAGASDRWIADYIAALANPSIAPRAVALIQDPVTRLPKTWQFYFLTRLGSVNALQSASAARVSGSTPLGYLWSAWAEPFRDSPQFLIVAESANYLPYWREYGLPRACELSLSGIACR